MSKKREPKTAELTLEWGKYPHYKHIVGLDEAGRGAWAGALVVGAVALPLTLGEETLRLELAGVRDSKEMTRLSRERLVKKITDMADAWGVGVVEHHEVDELKLTGAIILGIKRALVDLQARYPHFTPDYLFTDGLMKGDLGVPYDTIVKGDQKSLSIAAASVIAKTYRDDMMRALDNDYPQYHFGQHKGYGTNLHRQAIQRYGILPIHRHFYSPIQKAGASSDNPPLIP
jgi:ribonuclease HII